MKYTRYCFLSSLKFAQRMFMFLRYKKRQEIDIVNENIARWSLGEVEMAFEIGWWVDCSPIFHYSAIIGSSFFWYCLLIFKARIFNVKIRKSIGHCQNSNNCKKKSLHNYSQFSLNAQIVDAKSLDQIRCNFFEYSGRGRNGQIEYVNTCHYNRPILWHSS